MKRLSGWDAMLLYSETRNVNSHTVKVAVIDATAADGFTFERFRETLRRRLPLLEPLRYQLVDIPGRVHHPMWQEDCDVDLDYHLRRVTVPAPGGRRELDGVVGDIASHPLDRAHPLWEFHFVEGLADGRYAIIAKVHHALADGVASANLLSRAVDPQSPTSDAALTRQATVPSTGALLQDAARDHLEQARKLPQVVKDTAAGVSRIRRRSRERGRHPAMAEAFNPPATFMNHVLPPGRSFATATLSLEQAKQTSKSLGVTLNDLVLAISTGALRELLLRYDGRAEAPLMAAVPASTDKSLDRISGNALSTLLVSLPVHVDDPGERVRLVSEATVIAKENYQLLGPELIGRWTEYMPPIAAPSMFRWLSKRRGPNKLYNLTISNVPGPRETGIIAGAPISEFYSVGPLTAGSAINITVWSYVDQLNVSVIADDATFEDPHEVTDAMVAAYAAIRDAWGLSDEVEVIATAMAAAPAMR